MLSKAIAALILVPLAVVLISLAVANRQAVTLSLDPLDRAHPGLVLEVPLFALVLALVIAGVVVGGVAAWLRQGKWRRAARLAQAEARELRAEVDRLKQRMGPAAASSESTSAGYAPQLTIPPPAA